MTWTAEAEALDADRGELGTAVAHLFAAAWRARVDLDALGALAGATTALGQRLKLSLRGEVLPSDREMRERTEDFESDAGEMLRSAGQMRADVTAAWSRACDQLRAAQASKAGAQTAQEAATARAAEADALRRIADCEVALEILGENIARLDYALGCLQRVPDDLAVTYEAAYAHLRHGGILPRDGDFLTGTIAPPDSSRHAMAR